MTLPPSIPAKKPPTPYPSPPIRPQPRRTLSGFDVRTSDIMREIDRALQDTKDVELYPERRKKAEPPEQDEAAPRGRLRAFCARIGKALQRG